MDELAKKELYQCHKLRDLMLELCGYENNYFFLQFGSAKTQKTLRIALHVYYMVTLKVLYNQIWVLASHNHITC